MHSRKQIEHIKDIEVLEGPKDCQGSGLLQVHKSFETLESWLPFWHMARWRALMSTRRSWLRTNSICLVQTEIQRESERIWTQFVNFLKCEVERRWEQIVEQLEQQEEAQEAPTWRDLHLYPISKDRRKEAKGTVPSGLDIICKVEYSNSHSRFHGRAVQCPGLLTSDEFMQVIRFSFQSANLSKVSSLRVGAHGILGSMLGSWLDWRDSI